MMDMMDVNPLTHGGDFKSFLECCERIKPVGKRQALCNKDSCIGLKLSLVLWPLSQLELDNNGNHACGGYSKKQLLWGYCRNKLSPFLKKDNPLTLKAFCNDRKALGDGSIVLILKVVTTSRASLGIFDKPELDQIASTNGMCFPVAKLGNVLQHPELINDVFLWCFDPKHFPAGNLIYRPMQMLGGIAGTNIDKSAQNEEESSSDLSLVLNYRDIHGGDFFVKEDVVEKKQMRSRANDASAANDVSANAIAVVAVDADGRDVDGVDVDWDLDGGVDGVDVGGNVHVDGGGDDVDDAVRADEASGAGVDPVDPTRACATRACAACDCACDAPTPTPREPTQFGVTGDTGDTAPAAPAAADDAAAPAAPADAIPTIPHS
ncbi:hypothetical protein THAOC_08572 [Thalassiosira oceanica]|uniref:Uncharacterized protein n=1 Tax=Thalassiosira oceanica TaxID=159749 RepID=K0THV6_THAOC|nr:hypothetical protein THAOC_08572 [Thalassiosira oceanica]|eukprot:EJK70097.1 hypothetical protein THAOC_08572 [Thalassiosira oceanica]